MLARFSLSDGTYTAVRSLDDCTRALTAFIALCGEPQWHRRSKQIADDLQRSPYDAKIVSDHHWVEAELAWQTTFFAVGGTLGRGHIDLRSLAALAFAGSAVDLYEGLTRSGQRILQGRLRDALNNGFAGLFLELDTAIMLMEAGCAVSFPISRAPRAMILTSLLGKSNLQLSAKPSG